MEIVINKCYGGFGLSTKALRLYALKKFDKKVYFYLNDFPSKNYIKTNKPEECLVTFALISDYGEYLSGKEMRDVLETDDYISSRNIKRNDPILIEVVKELGEKANTRFSNLCVVGIPNNVEWEIEEYDGIEWISEKHKTWE